MDGSSPGRKPRPPTGRRRLGLVPYVYFDWTEGSPLAHFPRFILWGSGAVSPVTREVLRRAEPDRSRRPHVHAG